MSIDAFIRESFEDNECSPDMAELQTKYTHVPIFVYGTEQRGYSEKWILEDTAKVGSGKTLMATYSMYTTREHEPAVFHRPLDPNAAAIRGELYVVPLMKLFRLDRMYNNGRLHLRRMISIRYKKDLPFADLPTTAWFHTEAFMYTAVAAAPYWINRKDAGELKLKSTFRETDPKFPVQFHVFTSMDDKTNREERHLSCM